MKKITIFLFILTIFAGALSGSSLKTKQIDKLKLVKRIALQYPNKKGETFEKTAMSICLTETYAGRIKIGDVGKVPNIFNSSLGIMQVRLETARFIAKKLKMKEVLKLNDVDLVNKLLGDDKFNVTIAIRYLVWLNNHTDDYFRTVSRYNGGNSNYPYFSRVMKNMKRINKVETLVN